MTGEGIDISAITQVGFSVAMCWYLLTTFKKQLETLSELIKDTQKETLDSTKETKEMFGEIRGLIKETCNLVHISTEAVRVQSELTKATLDRFESVTMMREGRG